MPEPIRVDTATMAAWLNPWTGDGVLVLPRPEHDVPDMPNDGRRPAHLTLHEAEWAAMFRRLPEWMPSEDEHGDWLHLPSTPDGREVIGLVSDPGRDVDLAESAEACRGLEALASST